MLVKHVASLQSLIQHRHPWRRFPLMKHAGSILTGPVRSQRSIAPCQMEHAAVPQRPRDLMVEMDNVFPHED
jgi:hypothetical protein